MMLNILPILLILLQASPRPLSSINILRSAPKNVYVWSGMEIKSLNQDTIKIRLTPGETLNTQTIKLIPSGSAETEFKIEIRYQTSFSASDGSKNLVFLDWKHFTSEWRELEKKSKFTFIIPEYSEKERSIFPKVTSQEIFEELERVGGMRWVNFIKKEKQLPGYPFRVMLSKYLIKISVLKGGNWQMQNILEITPSLNC